MEDSSQDSRWWFYSWSTWGLLCAAVVLWIDRSPIAALFCLGIGVLVGRFGLLLFNYLPGPSFLAPNDENDIANGNAFSFSRWHSTNTLHLLDPNRRPWEVYLTLVCGMGLIAGTFIGGLVGSLLPLLYEWPQTAFRGALMGLVAGPLFVGSIAALVFPIILVSENGPSIEGIRSTVLAAGEEAERSGKMFPDHGHLLMALLHHPNGAIEPLFKGHEFDAEQVQSYIASQVPDLEIKREDELREEDMLFSNIIQDAIAAAKQMNHATVEPGHLLLAFLDDWPTVTTQTLAKIGVQSEDLREQIVNCLVKRD